MDNLIGKQLGPYRILEQIGLSGMTTVYKAYHATMDRYVAIKVLPPHMSSDPRFRKRFEREAMVIARLEHAHVLPVYDYGQAEGQLYLVMRYIEAGTLKERLAAGPMDLAEVRRIMRQVGGALTYAHHLGVVHRDVKPSNVLLDAQGDCYLTDFGLARIMESSIKLTATGVGVGTPAYMSPEQGLGEKVDVRSDIYSLGVTLYEMVTGQVPYQAETPMAVVLKHISAPLPLPRQVRPGIPQGVEQVILKAMAKNPDDRFQTAEEMVAALDAAVRSAGAEAPAAVGERAEAEGARPQAGRIWTRAAARLQEWTRTGWGRAVMWTALGIVALLVFFFLLSRVPLQVQIREGQIQVVHVVERTAAVVTPTEAMARATTTSTPRPTATSTPTVPTRTLTPTAARPTITPTPVPTHTPTPAEAPLVAPFPAVGITALAVDPNAPDTLFAGTEGAGIYISRDGGQTWMPSSEGLGKGAVDGIVVDPTDSDIIYAALFDQGGVYKSTDGGRTWSAANQGVDLDAAWDGTGLIYLDPADSTRLYYSGTTNGLYHSSDGAATWQQRSHAGPAITDLVIDPTDGEHLYVGAHRDLGAEDTTGSGVYESYDGGRTWQWLAIEEMAAPGGDHWHLAADPTDLNVLYAGGQRGTYKTLDGGRSWTPILDHGCNWLAGSEVALYCSRGNDLLISPDGGQSWGVSTYSGSWGGTERWPFAVVPGDPHSLYAGSDMVVKSTDGGWTWTPVGLLGSADQMRLTVDPRDGDRLFLDGVGDRELFRSEDGGRTWQVIGSGSPSRGRITIDPTQDVIYLPNSLAILYRSKDHGETWEGFGSGYLTDAPLQLVPDPRNAKRLWSVCDCGTRPFLSEDSGETFTMVESFPRDVCFPILLVYRDGQRMYVVAWEGFYRSDDGGETWQSLEGLGGIYLSAALDPSNPDVVYVGSTHKGALKTTDGGHSWRPINNGLTNPAINELVIDPTHTQIIYAATDGGAFVSLDGGGNWSPLQGELGPNPIVYSIAVDANDPSRVYLFTPDGFFRLAGVSSPAVAVPTPTSVPLPSLSGRVTDAATGQGIAGATVEARLVGPHGWDYSATTSSDGSYAISGLATGDYVVRVIAPGYAREYYDNIVPSREAEIIHVTAPHETHGIDFDLTEGGSISGYVYHDQTGEPIQGVHLEASPLGEELDEAFHTVTASDGSYIIQGLALGEYRVLASAEGWIEKWYDNVHTWVHATPVKVTPPDTVADVNFGLDQGGQIAGYVVDNHGNPIQGAHVSTCASLPSGDSICDITDSKEDGSYLMSELPTASSYKVCARKPGFGIEWYHSKNDQDHADMTSVTGGNTTSGIDFTLDIGGLVTGHVYEEDGTTPISGIEIITYLPTGEEVRRWSYTEHDGSYVNWLGPGSYLILAATHMRGSKWVEEWYDDSYTMENATWVHVTASNETSDIDYYLAKAGSISGHVYDKDSVTPIAGASVYAFPTSGDHPGAGANTGSDGSYTIEGLPSGNYRVQATVSDHVAEYYSNAPDEASATEVQVNAPGDTPGIDFALERVAE